MDNYVKYRKQLGEVIATSYSSFTAESYELNSTPPLGGLVVAEDALVDRVDLGPQLAALDVDGHVEEPVEAAAGGEEDRFHVAQRHVGLELDVAFAER